MVKLQPSKLIMRVRFPLPAPFADCINRSNIKIMKKTIKLALAATAVVASSVFAEDCQKLSSDVTLEVTKSPEDVLSLVSKYVAANEGCGCEVVKAAIVVTEADKALVAQIVEAAISQAPKEMNTIATCAIAVAPDAHKEIQAVYAASATAQGSSYSVSEKGGYDEKGGGEVAAAANPLDFPNSGATGNNPVGPQPGVRPNVLPLGLPLIQPPVITPPSVTNVN